MLRERKFDDQMERQAVRILETKVDGRNSTVEAVRILAIFGIIMMHSTGSFFSGVPVGANCVFLILINDLGNIGVTLFALITGYYGIKNVRRKCLEMQQKIFFCSVISFAGITISSPENITTGNMLKAVFPVAGRVYWYATCYFYLLLVSPFLEKITEKLDRYSMYKFVMTLILILSIIPTIFFFFPDTMQDGGKGMAWIVACYFVGGGYQRFRISEKISTQKLAVCFLVTQVAMFVGNTMLSIRRGFLYVPFARDCSFFILVSASCVLLLAVKKKRNSRVINQIASNVFVVYLTEGAVRTLITYFSGFAVYDDRWMLIADVTMSAMVLVTCLLSGRLMQAVFGRAGKYLVQKKLDWIFDISGKIKVSVNKYGGQSL